MWRKMWFEKLTGFAEQSPDPTRALYMEYNAVLDSPKMREKERNLVNTACSAVRSDPLSYLRKYDVTHVLWNFALRPAWDILQYDLPMRVIESTNNWILLELQ